MHKKGYVTNAYVGHVLPGYTTDVALLITRSAIAEVSQSLFLYTSRFI
jgi:hypothetical protein